MELRTCLASCLLLGRFTLGGCAKTLGEVDPRSLQADQAVLLFSTGASYTCEAGSTKILLKRSTSAPNIFNYVAEVHLNARVKSDLPGEQAKVAALVVEPGSYDFWVSGGPSLSYPDPVFTKPFHVASQEVVYLGQIYARGCGAGLRIQIRDRQERDLEYINSVYPFARLTSAQRRLLEIRDK